MRGIRFSHDIIFVLTLDAEADPDTIREHARRAVAGQPEFLRIKPLTGQERAKVLAFVKKQDAPETVVVQCDGALPPETKVKLSWGAEIRAASSIATDKDQVLEFSVRPAFTAHVECRDGSATKLRSRFHQGAIQRSNSDRTGGCTASTMTVSTSL